MKPFRELYYAIKTKRFAPDFTLFEYWVWRMNRYLIKKQFNHDTNK